MNIQWGRKRHKLVPDTQEMLPEGYKFEGDPLGWMGTRQWEQSGFRPKVRPSSLRCPRVSLNRALARQNKNSNLCHCWI